MMELSRYKSIMFDKGPAEGYSPTLESLLLWGMIDGDNKKRVRCLASREYLEDELNLHLDDHEMVSEEVVAQLWPKFQRLLTAGHMCEPQEEHASHLYDLVLRS